MAGTEQYQVEITARTSQFTAEMNKASASARKAADAVKSSFLGVQGTLAGLGVAFSAGAIVAAARETIAFAASLDDLADSTGSSVENLSRLANQAKISGTSFETLQGLMNKLAAGMAGADEESSKVGRALKALGVTAADPAQALNDVAVALNKYADGTAKAALARDLFGKGGPAFLATLKDIAEAQDVGATVTAKQAAEAEKLEKALRRLSVEATSFRDAVLSDVVPALSQWLEQLKEGIRLAGGFWSAVANFGVGVDPFKTLRQNIAETDERIKNLLNDTGAEARWAKVLGVTPEILAKLKARGEFLRFMERQQVMAGAGALGDLSDQVSRRYERKPKLDYTGAADKTAGGRREVDEFAKAMERLRREAAQAQTALDEAFSGEKISNARKQLAALQASDEWKKFTGAQQAELQRRYMAIDAIERQTEAYKKEREEREKQIKAEEQLEDARARQFDRFKQYLGAFAEENDFLAKEIELVGQDATAREKLAASIQKERLEREAIAGGGGAEDLRIIEDQYQRRIALIDQMALRTRKFEQDEQIKSVFSDAVADQFAQVIAGTKSISDAFRDMERNIIASISRIAAQNIADAIFGQRGISGGGLLGGLFSGTGSWLSGLFGGGTQAAWTSGFDLPMGFAAGGMPPLNVPSLVGEKGPELFVPRTAGVVIPNDVLQGKRAAKTTIINNISVPAGTTSATASQIALETGRAVSRVMRRNG